MHKAGEIDKWIAKTNVKCLEYLNISPSEFPCLFFQKYNTKTNRFTVGLKTNGSKAQSNRVKRWCEKNMKKEKYPRFISYGRWKWNKNYTIIKFDVPSINVYIPMPKLEPKPKKQLNPKK